MRNTLLIVGNTFKVTFRKKSNIFIYILLPLIGVLLSMVIYNGAGVQTVRVGVTDKDNSVLSSGLVNALKELDGYAVSALEEKDINDSLLDSKQDAVIVIPEGYGESIFSGQAEKMRIVSLKGQETTVWVQNYINLYTRNLSDLSAASGGNRAVFEKMVAQYRTNPLKLSEIKLEDERIGKYMTLSSMGFLIMFIMLGAGFTSQIILQEKRTRTYHRICSAPVSQGEYITGNTLASLLIICIQIIVILLLMQYVFSIRTHVPVLLMFAILLFFGMVAIGICLLVNAFSSSSYMAGTLNTLILTPTCMLGGCFWSMDLMPEFMQKIAWFTPQRWALDAIQKLQAGNSGGAVIMNVVILLAFAAAMFLVAAFRFARTNSLQKFV